jgi:hypothetical protein
VRVVVAVDIWVDLGEVRGVGLDDLVVAGDYVATLLGDGEGLRLALDGRVRPRGRTLLEAALREVRVGAKSPMETRARLVFTRAGLPEPEINAAVHDLDGGWILEGDLVWRVRQAVLRRG